MAGAAPGTAPHPTLLPDAAASDLDMPVTYVSTHEDPPMATCNDTYDLLTTASRINRAGRELIPLLRALPKPMLRTCNPVATSLAALAERRALAAPGAGVLSQIDALITGCDQCCRAKAASAGVMAQAGALRDRLVLLQELVAWLHDQLEARRSFSPAPRRQSAEAAEHRGIDHGPVG